MSTATLTDKDLRVRDAVTEQLDWDPAVDASGIGVSAREGAVTLTGTINTYAGKLAAERAAKRVFGVRAVANDIEVKLIAGRNDADIAADAATTWLQRQAAERAAYDVPGILMVDNRIVVEPPDEGVFEIC